MEPFFVKPNMLYFKRNTFVVLILFISSVCSGQKIKSNYSEVYNLDKKLELPLTIVLFGADFAGFNHLANKSGVDQHEVQLLNANNVWKFDRIATKQKASFREDAQSISDVALNISALLPGVLALDERIREDWFDILLLYGETHAINSGIYVSIAGFSNRARPFTYHPEVPLSEKTANETRNAFFSGHVSSAASASFFMAKVYSDYHPGLGNKKYWLFAAALVPPSVVGYFRVKAMKHFPSDVIVGGVIGASVGILVPHLHKTNKQHGLSMIPFTGSFSGLKLNYTF